MRRNSFGRAWGSLLGRVVIMVTEPEPALSLIKRIYGQSLQTVLVFWPFWSDVKDVGPFWSIIECFFSNVTNFPHQNWRIPSRSKIFVLKEAIPDYYLVHRPRNTFFIVSVMTLKADQIMVKFNIFPDVISKHIFKF